MDKKEYNIENISLKNTYDERTEYILINDFKKLYEQNIVILNKKDNESYVDIKTKNLNNFINKFIIYLKDKKNESTIIIKNFKDMTKNLKDEENFDNIAPNFDNFYYNILKEIDNPLNRDMNVIKQNIDNDLNNDILNLLNKVYTDSIDLKELEDFINKISTSQSFDRSKNYSLMNEIKKEVLKINLEQKNNFKNKNKEKYLKCVKVEEHLNNKPVQIVEQSMKF